MPLSDNKQLILFCCYMGGEASLRDSGRTVGVYYYDKTRSNFEITGRLIHGGAG